MILSARPPGDADLERAAELIRAGGLVAFPTETVYGLGANALDEVAVRKIFAAKERPWASPLIVHVADISMARSVCAKWTELAEKFSRRFWPGPLTLVVPKARLIPDVVTADLPSVGVRVPAHPVALELIKRARVPIAAPSANRFTGISPTTAAHVAASLGDRVDMILDGGDTPIGIESTVIALHNGKPMRTKFVLLNEQTPLPAGRGKVIRMPPDAPEFARHLYAALHQADSEGWDWIAIRAPAASEEWAGILDRLQRATTP